MDTAAPEHARLQGIPSLATPHLGGLPALPDTAAADASALGISPLLMATGCEEDGKGDLFSCCTLQSK